MYEIKLACLLYFEIKIWPKKKNIFKFSLFDEGTSIYFKADKISTTASISDEVMSIFLLKACKKKTNTVKI